MIVIGITLAACGMLAIIMHTMAGHHPVNWDEVEDRWLDKDDLR